MAQIKFSYGKYGIDKSKEPTQSLNVRIFHSNLDYRRTLKLDISREGYDFEKDHITDLSKGSRSEEEAKYLQSIKDILDNIKSTFDREFLKLRQSRKLESYIKQDWVEWCNKVIEQGRGGKIEDREFLVDKIKARREFLISKGNSQGTTDAWLTRINLLERFEDKTKHKYYTDEINLKFWTKSMNWIKEQGLTPAYHGVLIKTIKTTYNHFSSLSSDTSIWSKEINHKEFRVTASLRKDVYILKDDWSKIASYEGSKHLNNLRDLAIIQYQACLRYSELRDELNYYEKHGKFKDFGKEEGVYYWKIREAKNSNQEKEKFKKIPVHAAIISMVENKTLPHIINIKNANKYIKKLAQEVGIEYSNKISTHKIRHSKVTHLVMDGIPERDIKMLSGHKTEIAFQIYNHDKGRLDNHALPMV